MAYTEDQKRAIAENLAFRKEKAIVLREQRGRWVRYYKQGLMDGLDMPDARTAVLKRFDECTERKLDNALAYVGPSANPSADVLTEGKVLLHLQRMESDIQAQLVEYDKQMDDIDDKEALGEKYYEVELTETKETLRLAMKQSGDASGKGTDEDGKKDAKLIKTVTKKVPISEARHLILKRKVEAAEKYTVAVKNLRGGTIINIDNRSITADMSMDDLDREIAEHEKQRKIDTKGRVTIVEND